MTALADVYQLDQFIDTFALGHYARVLNGLQLATRTPVAFKVLRPEHLLADGELKWEYRAFGNEAAIMLALKDSPQVTRLYDCGYLSDKQEAPAGGEIVSFGVDVDAFTRSMYHHAAQGWRPYLALELMPRHHNLLYLMKPNMPGQRWRLPSEEALALAIQFTQMLSLAHAQNIVYLDHKLEHVYWDGAVLKLIDFNSSKQLGSAAREADFARDIHNLCVGILYPIFTGMSAQAASLRPQPGGLDVVESRYADVQTLDFAVEPFLSPAVQELLQRGAAAAFPNTTAFMAELQRAAALHGRDFPNYSARPSARQARDIMRQGLRELRSGTAQLRAARDHFRDALALDDLTPDLEDELRRLVKQLNEMLNARVIP